MARVVYACPKCWADEDLRKDCTWCAFGFIEEELEHGAPLDHHGRRIASVVFRQLRCPPWRQLVRWSTATSFPRARRPKALAGAR